MTAVEPETLAPHESCRHRVYRMTCSEFDVLRARARDRCEVCQATDAEFGSPLVIDHDHSMEGMTGVRGLLCGRCNVLMARVDSGVRFPTIAEKRYLDSAWHKQRSEGFGPFEHREPRQRFSGYIPARTLRRARGLVAALHGTEHQVSLNGLINAGLRHECAKLERLTNDGQQYPPADEVRGPRGGRRATTLSSDHAGDTAPDD